MIDPDLHQKAKIAAAERGEGLYALIEEAVRAYLKEVPDEGRQMESAPEP